MSLKHSLKVMVVDDMSTSRGLITQSLDEIGIERYWVENKGEDALRSLISNPVHLVLSDYNMPEMDGLGLLRAMRGNKATARIGFILVTGRPTQEIVDCGKQLGMNNLLKKPFTTASLRQCIEATVGRL